MVSVNSRRVARRQAATVPHEDLGAFLASHGVPMTRAYHLAGKLYMTNSRSPGTAAYFLRMVRDEYTHEGRIGRTFMRRLEHALETAGRALR